MDEKSKLELADEYDALVRRVIIWIYVVLIPTHTIYILATLISGGHISGGQYAWLACNAITAFWTAPWISMVLFKFRDDKGIWKMFSYIPAFTLFLLPLLGMSVVGFLAGIVIGTMCSAMY